MSAPAELVVRDPSAIEQVDPSLREAAVTAYLSHARDQLTLAMEMTGPAAVAALKAQIATAAEATKQLGLSKEIQQDAQEMVRRAEYALGKAIRAAQERGEVSGRGDNRHTVRLGDTGTKTPVTAFATHDELAGGKNQAGIYQMTDGVTAAEFDTAISDAKDEGNLSRANVVRKVQGVKQDGLTPLEKLRKIRELAPTGMTSQQIGREIATSEQHVRLIARTNKIEIPADKVMRGTRRLDHDRFVEQTVMALEGLASGLDVLDLDQVDPSRIADWSTSLTDSLRALNRFAKQIKEMDQ